MFGQFEELARRRGVPLIAAMLDIDLEENKRRLIDARRGEHQKLMRPDVLLEMRNQYRLLAPKGPSSLRIDVTTMSESEAGALFAVTSPVC